MISVTIDTLKFENPVHLGMYILRELQRVGIPAVGLLAPIAVERGVLSVGEIDLSTGEVVWTWREA